MGRAGPAGRAGPRSYIEEEGGDGVALRKKAAKVRRRGRRWWRRGRRWRCRGRAGKIL
jgi:hypothetical protein